MYAELYPDRYSLSAGCIETSGQSHVMTVGHLFEENLGEKCYAWSEVDNKRFVCEPLYSVRNIEIPEDRSDLDCITADIALLKSVDLNDGCTYNNRICLQTTQNCTKNEFHLSLFKGDIIRFSSVVIRDRDDKLQYGHILSTNFTDKDEKLYNTITIIDTLRRVPTAITKKGDSGALVMQKQDIVRGIHTDVRVYGMVTGLFEDNGESMTVANRLWDVLNNWDSVDNKETVDFISN